MTETLVKLDEFPSSSAGAPLPVVMASEDVLHLLYLAHRHDPDFDGSLAEEVSAQSKGQACAWIKFTRYTAFQFGPPSDEVISGHRLYGQGLEPYGTFEVSDSAWIEALKRQNAVHPYHRDSAFDDERHLIFTFHDSTLEVVASDFNAQLYRDVSLNELAAKASKELD